MKTHLLPLTVANRAFLIIFILFLQTVDQKAVAQFAYNMGGAGFDRGIEVELDAAGNAYFIGEFSDTLDFDPGSGEHLLKNAGPDVYVSSYDAQGGLRFAFRISGMSKEKAGDIAVQSDGSFVITGTQPFGFIDFDPDPLEETVRTGELFIAGYSNQGKIRFAVSPNGGENTSSGSGNAIALDEEGNVYVTGSYATSLDFNPPDTTSGVLPNAGQYDGFVASYTSTGKYRFSFRFGGAGYDLGSGIGVDSQGNIVVAGFFGEEAFFDPDDTDGNGNLEARTPENNSDMFLASYDKDGKFRFVYTYDITNRIIVEKKIGLSIDAADNVYISGVSEGTVAFDPEDADGNGNMVFRTAEALGSAFLASYNADGLIRFATVLKGGYSYSNDVFLGKDGVSFLTGGFSGDVDFDPNVGEAVLSSRSGADVFVASYDATGAYRLAFNLPSNGLSAGEGIAVDSLYNIVLTGGIGNDLDMQIAAGEDWRTSLGQDDIFMARFASAGQVSVGIDGFETQPSSFTLLSPYPNPFAGKTTFEILLPEMQQVNVAVFDALGRQVEKIYGGLLTPGRHKYEWAGGNVSNGLYFIRVENGTSSEVRSVVLLH